MKQMLTGPMQFTPYRPWSEERKAARRHSIARARGREINVTDPKREYCGPYLTALPAPRWRWKYVPTVPPYRIRFTRLTDGKEHTFGDFLDQRIAIASLCGLYVPIDQVAEVLDAEDTWIMRVSGIAAGHPS